MKKVSKSKVKGKWYNTLAGFVAVVSVLVAVAVSLPSGPKYSIGECFVNRMYEPVRIADALDNTYYRLETMKTVEVTNGWYLLSKNEDKPMIRDEYFISKYYVKVPCTNFELDSL